MTLRSAQLRARRLALVGCLARVLLGCSASPAGTHDAGVADASRDGTAQHEAGSTDARPSRDSRLADAPIQFADVFPQDALSADGSFGDAPANSNDGSECTAPMSFCAGECVDEQTDPSHCGGCAVTCAGQCALGRCLVTLASDQGLPAGIAVTSAYVLWTNRGSTAASTGSVIAAPLGGLGDAGTLALLATAQASPFGITADGANVYWTNVLAGTVMTVPLSAAGGTSATPVTLASGQSEPSAVVVDPARVYWTAAGADAGAIVARALADGGAIATFASDQHSPTSLAVDSARVYWGTTGGVMALPLVDGGAPALLAAGVPTAIAVGGASVYWTNLGTAANDYGDGEVLAVSLAGSMVTTLATGQAVGAAIATDGTSVYWTTRATASARGTIMKVAVGGGTPVTVVTGQSPSGGMAVDATSVYWTSGDVGGSVVKVTPK